MKIKCPNCHHEFAVKLTADEETGRFLRPHQLGEAYRRTVDALTRPPTILPQPIDPDRPVSK